MVYVDDLYVAPAARGQRLSSRLLDEARAWGYAQGATELRAGVLAANATGRHVWAREGRRGLLGRRHDPARSGLRVPQAQPPRRCRSNWFCCGEPAGMAHGSGGSETMLRTG